MKEKGIVIVAICLLIVGGMCGCVEEEKEGFFNVIFLPFSVKG